MNKINNTKEMFKRAQNGDKQTREKLIENNIGFAISIAVKYIRSKDIDIETAKQEAIIGLIKAVDDFNPDKYENKMAFTTYAYNKINWQIIDFIRNKRENIPYKLREEDFTLRTKIFKAMGELTEKLQRFPTSNDIAKNKNKEIDSWTYTY